MKLTTAFLSILATTSLCAQKTEEGFDASFKPTKGSPRYYVVTEQKDSAWYREAYYVPEKSMAMKGTYSDPKCKNANGEVIWFHPNKNLRSVTHYTNGKKDGPELKYHENGMMSDSSNYSNGRLTGIGLGWDAEGFQVDSSNFDGAGNGVTVHWHAGGPPFSTGRWTNDTTKVGRWTYYHPNGKLLATEDYVNGKRTQCNCFDENANPLDASLCVEEEAYFPGKDEGWKKFVQTNLDPNVPVRNRAPEGMYTVMVQFVVDKDGKVSDIKPLTQFGFGMEGEVVRMLKRSPKWTPAIQFGRKVKAYRKQPVTFMVTKG